MSLQTHIGSADTLYSAEVLGLEQVLVSEEILGSEQVLGLEQISSSEQAFGPNYTEVVAEVVDVTTNYTLTDGWVYHILVFALFIYYAFILLRVSGYVREIFQIIRNKHVSLRVSEESVNLIYSALKGVTTLGILLFGLTTVKITDVFELVNVEKLGVGVEWLPILVILGYTLTIVIHRGFTSMIGGVTMDTQFTTNITALKKMIFGFMSIITTPLVLIFLVNTGPAMIPLACLILTITVAFVLLFILKTIILFIEKKVSILLWFLYLCTVEIIPIAVLLIILMR